MLDPYLVSSRLDVVGAHGVVGFREQVIPSGSDQNGIHINGNDPANIAWA